MCVYIRKPTAVSTPGKGFGWGFQGKWDGKQVVGGGRGKMELEELSGVGHRGGMTPVPLKMPCGNLLL